MVRLKGAGQLGKPQAAGAEHDDPQFLRLAEQLGRLGRKKGVAVLKAPAMNADQLISHLPRGFVAQGGVVYSIEKFQGLLFTSDFQSKRRAGLPSTVVCALTDLNTTLPAATTACSPMCAFGVMIAPG